MTVKKLLSVIGLAAISLGIIYNVPAFLSYADSNTLPAPNHSMMLGYYHVSAQYGDFSNDVKNYTNTALIIQDSFLRDDGTNDITGFNNAFNKAIANNQKIVFLPSFSPPSLLDRGLEAARPFWNKIDLIYMADEPNWDKATTENNITSFKNTLSAKSLSQKEIAINYTNQQIMTGTSFQANNLDVVGFEAYMDVSQQNSSTLVTSLNNQINASKAKIGNKKMFIVIQSYDRNGTWTNLNSLQSIQTPPYLKSYNDNNIIGLFMFTYARSGGTKDLGACISTEHKRIWGAISGTTQPTTVSCGANEPPVTAPSYNATAGWGGSLVYNPNNNNWLVVSASTQIGGRIMGNDGTQATQEFKINQDTGVQVMAPKVSFAPDINKYLVVWIGFPDPAGGTIYGRFVNPDGSFGGNAFTVFKDPADGGSILYSNSTLQYDSKNKKFVFVWDYRHPKADVNLITISQSGVPGTAVKVGNDSNGESWVPSLAINENSNEYCVAYDKRNSGNKVAAVRKYNAVTGVLGTETILNTAGMYTSIVYNSVNNKYLIGWNSGSSLTSQAKILNSCNITDGGSVFTSNNAGQTQTLSYNPKSNNYASIVQNQNDAGNTYNVLDSTGRKLTGGIAFAGGYGNFAPIISANSNDGTFAATSSKDYAITRFAPGLGIASSNTPSTPIYLDLGGGTFPDVVWYQNRLYVVYRQGSSGNYINLYSFDKNLGDKKTEKIFNLNPGAGGFPRLTVSNNTLWVAFRDGTASGEDIKLWRQDTGVIESLGGGVGNDPVALGYGYIAWQKCEGTNCTSSKVYRRLLTGGTSTFIRNWLPTGISRILSNGNVVMIDTDRTAVSWGLRAWFAGPLIVATDVTPTDDNGIAARFDNLASSEFNLWLGQRAHTPHAATDGLGNYAVATWNPTVRVAVIKKPESSANNPPVGVLDEANCDIIGGWAVDKDTPSQSITVEIFVDGQQSTGTKVYSGITTGSRPDVNSALGVTGNHGFTLYTPDSIKDGNNHDIWVYAKDSATHQNVSFDNNHKVFHSASCTTPPPPPPPTPFVPPVCSPLPYGADSVLECNFWALMFPTITY